MTAEVRTCDTLNQVVKSSVMAISLVPQMEEAGCYQADIRNKMGELAWLDCSGGTKIKKEERKTLSSYRI